MRDPAFERAFPTPLYRLFNGGDHGRRPSCFTLLRFSAWMSHLEIGNRLVHVVTCSSHYCRSLARELIDDG